MADQITTQGQQPANALAALDPTLTDLLTSKYGTDEAFKGVSGTGFFPRLQLNSFNSKLCKKGVLQTGTFAIIQSRENIVADLGKEFHCFILAWRPKALRIGEETKGFYNPSKDVFKSIERDSQAKIMGNMYGPEFLVFIPGLNLLPTFFFSNPTMRNVAGDMKGRIGKWATVSIALIENKQYSWHGPVIKDCTAGIAFPEAGTPEAAAVSALIRPVLEKFQHPPEEAVEEADEPADSERAR